MLRVFYNLNTMSFASLLDVYSGTLYDDLEGSVDLSIRRIQAEQDFYSYLKDVFFKNPTSFYAVWVVQGRYMSTLRMEEYCDGLLLEALETAPDVRGNGHATNLLLSVIDFLSKTDICVIYAHVDKKNMPSLRVHEKCGFTVFSNTATYIDGSFNSSSYTMRRIIA